MSRIFLLMGPANVGKSTLFERLTGVKTVRLNRPGVTVDTIRGKVGDNIIVDTPGIITSGGIDVEKLKDILLAGDVYGVIFVVDATNLAAQLTLFLATAMVVPRIILVINMIDIAEKHGIKINADCLSKRLGVPVLLVSARKGTNIDALKCIIEKDRNRKPHVKTFMTLEEALKEVDNPDTYEELAILAQDIAYNCAKIRKRHEPIREFFDYILLNPFTGFPLMLLILSGILWFSLWVTSPIADRIESILPENQVINIIGIVFSILPLVLVYTFFLAILEDTGILTRSMVMLHDLVRKLGINGRLIAPLFLALGCNVPSIMLTRGAENLPQRRVAVMSIPFVPCSARMAVIAYIAYRLSSKPFLVILSAYTSAFIAILFTLRVFSKLWKPPSGVLAITLGPYTLPDPVVIGRRLRRVFKEFTIKVGFFVTLAALLYVYLIEPRIIKIASALAPILNRPEAFVEAAIMGFIAKEVVIGVLDAYTISATLSQTVSYAVFITLYTPCVGTFAAIGTEVGRRYAFLSLFRSLSIALIASFFFGFIVL